MKKYLIIVLFLLGADASAQPPRIDSMYINESKGILNIVGRFDTVLGNVQVDSVELQVVSWSDSLISASIPDSGRGSAGPVTVSVAGKQSDSRMITLWIIHAAFKSDHYYDVGSSESNANYDLFWRLDVHSLLKHNTAKGKLYSDGMSISKTTQSISTTFFVGGKYTHTRTDTVVEPYDFSLTFDFDQKNIVPYLQLFVYSDGWPAGKYSYDSAFNMLASDTSGGAGSITFSTSIKPQPTQFPPPPRALSLVEAPLLIAPKNDSVSVNPSNVELKWDSLALMDFFRLEVSTDSLFTNAFDDSTIHSVHFLLSGLRDSTKYFWRVAGINSEGESRWSQVWHFTTERDPAGVVAPSSLEANFTCTPNPASNILNITLPAPARVVVYDLRGNVVRSVATSEPTLRIETGDIASGTYVVGVTTPSTHQSQIIQILH